MSKTIEGIYRDGKIELAESPCDVPDKTRVVVTFLGPATIRLPERDIDEVQAAELRGRLASFAEEWDSPEMTLYDNYDVSKNELQTR